MPIMTDLAELLDSVSRVAPNDVVDKRLTADRLEARLWRKIIESAPEADSLASAVRQFIEVAVIPTVGGERTVDQLRADGYVVIVQKPEEIDHLCQDMAERTAEATRDVARGLMYHMVSDRLHQLGAPQDRPKSSSKSKFHPPPQPKIS